MWEGRQNYFHKYCVKERSGKRDGACLNHEHEPKWENIGKERYKTIPGILGKKTYWTIRHCGKAMRRCRLIQTRICKRCKYVEDKTIIDEVALCVCCGHYLDMTICW